MKKLLFLLLLLPALVLSAENNRLGTTGRDTVPGLPEIQDAGMS